TPIEEKHRQQHDRERRQFEISPDIVILAAFVQFLANRADIVTEKAEENIAPWTFRLPIVPMTVDRQPINSVAIFILSIRITLVMLHVDGVVHCLRKAT